MVSEFFVGVCHSDGVIRLLSDFNGYAVPFSTHIDFREDKVPLLLRFRSIAWIQLLTI